VQETVWQKLTDAGLALHSELSLRAVLKTLVDHASSVTMPDHQWSASPIGLELASSIPSGALSCFATRQPRSGRRDRGDKQARHRRHLLRR
jgi:hypothetical protein